MNSHKVNDTDWSYNLSAMEACLLPNTSVVGSSLGSCMSSAIDFFDFQGFENMHLNHVGCTKSNYVNVNQFNHMEPMGTF